jgi:hypothetical protein
MLHEFFMLYLLSSLMVALHLVFKLFYPVASFSVLLQLLPPEIVSVKQLTLEKSDSFMVLFHTINNLVQNALVDVTYA